MYTLLEGQRKHLNDGEQEDENENKDDYESELKVELARNKNVC